jgi:methylenetetrahydrofolate dehydrogenase (NADP+)/methenyltetrahydrofolate cyclohydrolase
MVEIIDGKQVAASVIQTVKSAASALEKQSGVKTGLSVIIVGDDPASHAYVGSKSKMAKECGFTSVQHTLAAETRQEELAALVASLTGDLQTGLVSCTPAGAMVFVRRTHGEDLSGLNAVVIGRSNLFGKPMAQLLLNANATVTIAHSRTKDLASVSRNADILVAAVGRPQMVKADWVKPGATVIDVGINRIAAPERGEGKTRLVGDVAFAEALEIAGAITPVPGGVGQMTVACLLVNTLRAACAIHGLAKPAV